MYDSDIHLNHRLLLCFIPSYLNKIPPPPRAPPLLFAIPHRKPLQQPVWKKGGRTGTTPKISLYIRLQVQKCPAHKSGLSNSFCPAPGQWKTNQNHRKGDSPIVCPSPCSWRGLARAECFSTLFSCPCPVQLHAWQRFKLPSRSFRLLPLFVPENVISGAVLPEPAPASTFLTAPLIMPLFLFYGQVMKQTGELSSVHNDPTNKRMVIFSQSQVLSSCTGICTNPAGRGVGEE